MKHRTLLLTISLALGGCATTYKEVVDDTSSTSNTWTSNSSPKDVAGCITRDIAERFPHPTVIKDSTKGYHVIEYKVTDWIMYSGMTVFAVYEIEGTKGGSRVTVRYRGSERGAAHLSTFGRLCR